jgi:glycosyltransferase involved in cell wall biosynthesis
MKVLLFSPYIDPPHAGGGEKYLFDIAASLVKLGHQVMIGVPSKQSLSSEHKQRLKLSYEDFMGRDLSEISFISTPLRTKAFILRKILWTRQFDVLFYLTDGSLFLSLAKKNILHVQFPFRLDKTGWWQQFKLDRWQLVTTNSKFTKQVVEPTWPVKVDLVHQPMVQVQRFAQPSDSKQDLKQKEKIILNVGRFFSHLHSKRQDVIVDMFQRLLNEHPRLTKGWKLVLIGGVEDADYARQVTAMAADLPVEIYHDVTRQELIDWFQRASIYWHATGYRVNAQKEPEKVEHFGITTVEAMAAGNAPIVIGKGGQIEVVGPDLADWTWLTKRDCLKKTLQVIKNSDLRHDLQQQARRRARHFGQEQFEQKIADYFV